MTQHTPSDLAFTHAPIGLVILENRIIKSANALFAEIFGGAPQSYIDTPLEALYPSREDYERIGARGLEAMRTTGRYADERVMRRRDGTLFGAACVAKASRLMRPSNVASGALLICPKSAPLSPSQRASAKSRF